MNTYTIVEIIISWLIEKVLTSEKETHLKIERQKEDGMKTVVITGSTRGIGFGLANEFLQRDCQVVINGRSTESVQQAWDKLAKTHASDHIFGFPGAVTDIEKIQLLWDAALAHFGHVDIWINNAGLAHETEPVWELPAETMKSVVDTNILGTMYASSVAMQGMLAQGHGQIYNMEGFGAGGDIREGMSIYGTSKAAVRYYSKALIAEAKETAVQIGILSPGMVMTDLVLNQFKDKPDELEKVRRIFNIIADRVENVTPWLVDKMLENQKNGAHLVYAPPMKLAWRFISSPIKKRDVFPETN